MLNPCINSLIIFVLFFGNKMQHVQQYFLKIADRCKEKDEKRSGEKCRNEAYKGCWNPLFRSITL